MGRRRVLVLLDALAVLGVALLLSLLLDLAGLPSPTLFGGLAAGLGRALVAPGAPRVPRWAGQSGQAVIGVMVGTLVDVGTLEAVARDWLPVLLVTVGTLVLSLLGAAVLRLQRGISSVTAAFSMLAGGAAGVTAMADELGADQRMVAVLQYLRVLLVLVFMPVVATVLYGGAAGNGSDAMTGGGPGWAAGVLLCGVCGVAGVLLGRLLRLPVAAMLGPLVLAAALDLSGWSRGAEVPGPLAAAAFLVIGLQVGLTFTRASLAVVGRALPAALALIVAVVAASAGLGAVLSWSTGVSALDGYLATTPGGLYAVLATASDSGADATFVLAVQVLRLFAVLLSAPLVAAWLRRRAG
ncbi:AbrB family transcriptional regulator [Geodermatophilus sp. YIM 151500]|uniref:AbrB family transcriptional regulator n=1 Tax=Geodermatophilus sp. YIM 151500 TaxID=2984531 RepID=UPI0021E3A8E9|nr:AbrB family transcriptional regulator [Geodermatophilus sp. YIM 151500]MCV2491009.1 AbrB family transcriptional regulator [Geodermatophilus sp. YIM 151500]